MTQASGNNNAQRASVAKREQALSALARDEPSPGAVRHFADDVAKATASPVAPKQRAHADARPSFANGVFRKGASSREAYDFIVAITGDGVDDEADEWIQHYYVSKVQGLTTVFVVALIVGVLGVLVGNAAGGATLSLVLSWLASFVVLAGLIVLVMVSVTKRRIGPKITTALSSGRDPVTFCGRYLAYLREKEPKDLTEALWLYSTGLRWQGRWDEAQKLFERYLKTYGMEADARAQSFHHQLLAGVAFDKDQYLAMCGEIAYLESIPKEELPQEFEGDLALICRLSQVLALERDGKKQEAYDLVESFFYHSENVLRMALALHMGLNSSNRTDALEWINFVIKMGMSTWCVKRAKDIRATGKLQKLPKGESRFGMNVRERRKDAKKKRKERAVQEDLEQTADSLPQVPR